MINMDWDKIVFAELKFIVYDFLFHYVEKAADGAKKTEEAVAEEEEGLNYIFTISNQFFTCLLVKSHGRSEHRPEMIWWCRNLPQQVHFMCAVV